MLHIRIADPPGKFAKTALQARALLGRVERFGGNLAVPEQIDQRPRLAEQRLEGGGSLGTDEIVGIEPIGQRDEGEAAPRLEHRHGAMRSAEGRLLPGRIAVEAEEGDIGYPPQPFELMLGHRGAERRHRLAETGLGEGDHVHIALDRNDPPGLACRGLGAIQIVERAPLVEERRLGGIEIFRLALADDAPAKGDGPASHVADRDHQSAAEPIVRVLLLHRDQQAGLDQHGIAIALERVLQLAARIGREADAEGPGGFVVDPTLPEHRARLGAFDAVEALDEEPGGVLHCLVQPLGALGLLGAAAILLGHFHAGRLDQLLHRIDEGQAALIGHPADRIAVRAAAEAMVEALVVVDVEGRRLLVMERAAGTKLPSRLLELHRLGDEAGEQGAGAELVQKGGGKAHLRRAPPSPGRSPCSCPASSHGAPSAPPSRGPCPSCPKRPVRP